MSTILHIETSTDVCSVAVSQDGKCIFEREDRPEFGGKDGNEDDNQNRGDVTNIFHSSIVSITLQISEIFPLAQPPNVW